MATLRNPEIVIVPSSALGPRGTYAAVQMACRGIDVLVLKPHEDWRLVASYARTEFAPECFSSHFRQPSIGTLSDEGFEDEYIPDYPGLMIQADTNHDQLMTIFNRLGCGLHKRVNFCLPLRMPPEDGRFAGLFGPPNRYVCPRSGACEYMYYPAMGKG